MFYGIDRKDIERIWPTILPKIKGAIESENGDYHPEEIKGWLKTGHCQLWLHNPHGDIQSLCITMVDKTEKRKFATIILAAGKDSQEWAECVKILEKWAIAEGCSHIEYVGRRGFEKLLKPMGWTGHRVIMKKVLI